MRRWFGTALVALCVVGIVWWDGPQHLMVVGFDAPIGKAPSPVESTCAQPCDAPPLGVRSFNVLCSFCAKEGYDDWETRLPHLRAAIFRHSPDLIGLQELVGEADVASIFGLDSPYTMVSWSVAGKVYADSALFYRTARFVEQDSGQIWLSRSPMLPLSRSWTLSFPRVIQWVLLEDRLSGATVLFANTHLDNNGENKIPSAALFGQAIPPMAGHVPVIVTGDFNTRVDDARFDTIRGTLVDVFSQVDQPEFSGQQEGVAHTRRAVFPDQRIDHILVSEGVEVLRAEHSAPVFGEPPGRPSDHPTIYAEVVLDR